MNTTKTQPHRHKVRTFFASLAGIAAVCLVLASLTVIWLNRTLTDTNTFVGTVAPLVTKPPIQNFVAQKATDQLLNSAPVQDVAGALLPANQITGTQTDAQLKALLNPIVKTNILKIVSSPSFATLWKTTNRTAHSALVRQLNNDSGNQLTLDLSPAVNGALAQIQTTQLAPIAAQVAVKPDTGKLVIKNDSIGRAHRYYKLFRNGTLAAIALTAILLALSVVLSVHHAKTARRILLGTGILALLQGLLLSTPQVVKLPANDAVTQAAAKTLFQALTQNLQVASLIVGILCLVLALGSKLYSKRKHSK